MITVRILPALIGFLSLLGALDALVSGNWAQEIICVLVFILCAIAMLRNTRRMTEDISRWTRCRPSGVEKCSRSATQIDSPPGKQCSVCHSPALGVNDAMGRMTRAAYLGSTCPSCGRRFCLQCAGKRSFVCSCGEALVDA